MANIVTQLQNKNGDNLYPLAGGMAADSITTAMIQDGAVTSDKVDFATLGNATKTYFVPSNLNVTTSTNDIDGQTSITITTSNADSAILVTVEAVMAAVNGQDFYPRVVVDGSNYSLAARNLQGNTPYNFTRIIPNLSAGSHTVSFGLSPNGTVRFAAYNDIRITATEIATPIR